VLLHDLEELDNDLGGGPDHNLALAALLGIVERVEGIVEDGSADHLGGIVWVEILKSGKKRGICQYRAVSLPEARGAWRVPSMMKIKRVLPAQLPERRSVSAAAFAASDCPPRPSRRAFSAFQVILECV